MGRPALPRLSAGSAGTAMNRSENSGIPEKRRGLPRLSDRLHLPARAANADAADDRVAVVVGTRCTTVPLIRRPRELRTSNRVRVGGVAVNVVPTIWVPVQKPRAEMPARVAPAIVLR